MPELPEVETTLRGVSPHAQGRIIRELIVRDARLRWPIPSELPEKLQGQRIESLGRRGKYILVGTRVGTLLVHLGMSGSWRIVQTEQPPRKHDHHDLVLDSGMCLRYHDPRRFGCLLWTEGDPARHSLIVDLGPEPLEDGFDGAHLHELASRRRLAVKLFIMDSHVVVGVGNIYANEALFRAGIAPQRPADSISSVCYERLAKAIRLVLQASIQQGGTTLRDFVNESGQPGYFRQTLQVYGRAGKPCHACGGRIEMSRLGQRATYWCPNCQT